MTYYTWLQNYFQNRKSERLGQAFCNDFIKGPWPELFCETDLKKAEAMIGKWLLDNHYMKDMPQLISVSISARIKNK